VGHKTNPLRNQTTGRKQERKAETSVLYSFLYPSHLSDSSISAFISETDQHLALKSVSPSTPDMKDRKRDRRSAAEIANSIIEGNEEIISHRGASQYWNGGSGTSACGLAALNCARVIFQKEIEGLEDHALLADLVQREAMEVSSSSPRIMSYSTHVVSTYAEQEITSICAMWPGKLHLEVEDIYQVPLFETSLRLLGTEYHNPSVDHFKNLLL
jgi:hypothetical protein